MKCGTQHLPVILLVGKRKKSHDEVDAWLAESPYSADEATDVFQALERVSDFTVGETPDVVFLHVESLEDDLQLLEQMLGTSISKPGVSVIALTDRERQADSMSGLGVLARQLNQLIPHAM
jgi:DNA-binding response OmpR family regulator